MSDPQTSQMEVETVEVPKATKRNISVDPDTLAELQESKRPKIALDSDKKGKCLTAIAQGFEDILAVFFGKEKQTAKGPETAPKYGPYYNIPVSIQISNIMFTLHTYKRQKASGKDKTNVITKSDQTDFTITYLGKSYSKPRDELIKVWENVVGKSGLIYKDFTRGDSEENWYGTFGPYIDFFCGFGLRLKELRIGHDKMPVGKKGDTLLEILVKKYGLNGAHHVLLEGCTFPPEKRSSMAQSMGPMTALLCMLRSEGMYRDKWANAVKRAFNHLEIIDDIIEITKGQRKAADISTMIGLLAEISLISTTRQATRIFFPLAMFHYAYHVSKHKSKEFLNFFSTTGSGAFYTYKMAHGQPWTMTGSMKEEMASQMVFHSIFGTYKEDLGILSEITNIATWYTREGFGKSFIKGDKKDTAVKVRLPTFKYYAKMSTANQSTLLAGTYSQVSSIPCFSGHRHQHFGDDFFNHTEKKISTGSSGKSISQIVSSLSITLDQVRNKVKEERGSIDMGTVPWRDFSTLDLDKPGDVVDLRIRGKGIYFLGRSPAKRT